jgi:leader peptidase (prepilin peptidase)/N-methyltransferase
MRRWSFHLAVASVVLAAIAYVFGFPVLQAISHKHYHYTELILPRVIDLTVFIWLFWVGSAIGSFLNVVAWRLPRNESINGRSYCPRCCSQLSARDNFPVFGWLALGGRCRTCRLPISGRYPIVESLVGASITAIGIAELLRLSLPLEGGNYFHGPIWSPMINREVLIVMGYHVVAVATSFACGLIRWDDHVIPTRLAVFAMTATAVPILIYPSVMVVSWPAAYPKQMVMTELGFVDAVLRVFCSLFAGIIYARVLAPGLCPRADLKLDPIGPSTSRLVDLVIILCIASMVVGWQAMPGVVLIDAVIAAIIGMFKKQAVRFRAMSRFAIAMPIAMTIQIASWRLLHQSGYWPSINVSPWLILLYASVTLTIPIWLRDSVAEPTPPPRDLNTSNTIETADLAGTDE